MFLLFTSIRTNSPYKQRTKYLDYAKQAYMLFASWDGSCETQNVFGGWKRNWRLSHLSDYFVTLYWCSFPSHLLCHFPRSLVACFSLSNDIVFSPTSTHSISFVPTLILLSAPHCPVNDWFCFLCHIYCRSFPFPFCYQQDVHRPWPSHSFPTLALIGRVSLPELT